VAAFDGNPSIAIVASGWAAGVTRIIESRQGENFMTQLFRHKIKFTERFKNRHSLRFHMSLILLATVCSGFLATRAMLALHLENVLLRYPLAVVFAYLIFFLSVKLWLKYIEPTPVSHKAHDNPLDAGDLLPDLPISFPSDAAMPFQEAGGGFDGGGATDSFGDVGTSLADSSADLFSGSADTGGGIGDAVGGAVGDVVGGVAEGLGDEGGLVAVVVFAVLAAIMTV